MDTAFTHLLAMLCDIADPRRAEGKLYGLPHVFLFSILDPKISPDTEGEVHWFCQKCFENKRKSTMQPEEFIPTGLYRVWACSVCGEKFQIEAAYSPAS